MARDCYETGIRLYCSADKQRTEILSADKKQHNKLKYLPHTQHIYRASYTLSRKVIHLTSQQSVGFSKLT